MIFSSVLFMEYFLPIVLLAYFIVPRNMRNLILFVASLLFYAWGEPIYVGIMIFSTIVDYTHGLLLERFQGKPKARKAVLISSMVINLGLLCFFKYSDFVITNLNAFLNTDIALLKLALPIGISFYTFQTMSYTIDVYLGNCEVQHNIISFGCYVAMFPQLIAGPIVRYVDIEKKLNKRVETIDEFALGIRRFCVGLGKKVLLANSIGSLFDAILAVYLQNMTLSWLGAWLGILAYAFQLYFDFSGYSDMAIGLGHMFGFHFPENFNYPYISKSISEFWRRWHISLGTWFKEYVYIPLGGNRVSKLKWARNVAIVWFLTGLWHGANWNFILWGLYFGVLLAIEKLYLHAYLIKLPSFVQWAITFVLIMFSWCLFSIENVPMALRYIGLLMGIGVNGIVDSFALYNLGSYGLLFVVLIIASTPIMSWLSQKLASHTKIIPVLQLCGCIIVLVISMAYLVDASYNPFLYFRF